jgi:4-amino-4-deoxy-L-arabinose transferase-like glycosyltransferase
LTRVHRVLILKELRWVLLVAVLAVAVRAVYFFAVVPWTPDAQDRDLYLQIARNVVADRGFSVGLDTDTIPTSMRPPFPVYYYAVILWIIGDHTLAIAFSNWGLDAAVCVLLYLLGLELFHDKHIALISSILFALYPPEIYYSWQALSEPSFCFFLSVFMLVFLRAVRLPSVIRFTSTGILLEATVLTRPIMQYYLPIAIATLIGLLYKRGRDIVKYGVWLTFSSLIVIIPWTLRNYFVFGQFISVSSMSGSNLYLDHYTLDTSDFLRPRKYLEESQVSLHKLLSGRFGPDYKDRLTQPERDAVAREEAVKMIVQYPGRYLVLSAVRFFRLWYYIYGVFNFGTSPPAVVYAVVAVHSTLWVLAVVAFVRYRNEWIRRSIPLLSLLLYYTLGYSAIHVQVRYVIPVVPYVMLFSSVAIYHLFGHITAFFNVTDFKDVT